MSDHVCTDDPRHICNVRASRAADQAEDQMWRDLEDEVDPRPRPATPFGMLRRALAGEPPAARP